MEKDECKFLLETDLKVSIKTTATTKGTNSFFFQNTPKFWIFWEGRERSYDTYSVRKIKNKSFSLLLTLISWYAFFLEVSHILYIFIFGSHYKRAKSHHEVALLQRNKLKLNWIYWMTGPLSIHTWFLWLAQKLMNEKKILGRRVRWHDIASENGWTGLPIFSQACPQKIFAAVRILLIALLTIDFILSLHSKSRTLGLHGFCTCFPP